jgi:RNA polymerase sigma-70 factor (ECF subfamily)
MDDDTISQLQGWVDRLRAGDAAARDELINRACDRLRRLTHKMLQDFTRLRRWEDTDDVLQNAVVRLLQALRSVTPATPEEFFRLAARQIRRELLDLARHYYGPQGRGAHHASLGDLSGSGGSPPPGVEASTSTLEPTRLAMWTEFHQLIEGLPPEERAVFDLVWYHGMTQAEAAAVLNVSGPTVKRRWMAARLHLQEIWRGSRALKYGRARGEAPAGSRPRRRTVPG